ncbi:MAG: signal peptide peptidase SppA, partial [Sandaracinaceae bacterium]|nr:signal peptide peptidase SppA [Sandaracinaceae bacterium]
FVRPRVAAVLAVLGAIGEAGPRGAASREQLVPTIRRLARDRSVGAVVLYVDSPGGSALASERIHREVEQLASQKPVVACFGEVAASGGYYVAAPAHVIVARPQTITGSIGVVSARLVLSKLFDTIGVRTEVVKNAPSADYLVNPRPATDDESATTERGIQAFYERFLEIVGRGRKMTRDAVDAIARGRVWTGADARTHGLVDELGGLREALAQARTRAGDASLEAAFVWPSGGEEAPLDAPSPEKAALLGLAAALDPELVALARLASSPSERVLAYAFDLPHLE